MMRRSWARVAFIAVAAGWLGLGIGCDKGGGGDSKPDVGLNDINTVVCIGDSITDGGCAPAGAPYPSRLAGLSGKTVINAGVCGSTSDSGAARVNGLLERHKPGYLCILYGINDLTFGRGVDAVIGNIQHMVDAAKANKTIPLVATLLPVYDSHRFAAGRVKETNRRIRALTEAMNVELVDLELEFGIDRSLIQEDGLHPSDSGNQLIALSFNDKL
jgi:lysophospholipase L1-like esterase